MFVRLLFKLRSDTSGPKHKNHTHKNLFPHWGPWENADPALFMFLKKIVSLWTCLIRMKLKRVWFIRLKLLAPGLLFCPWNVHFKCSCLLCSEILFLIGWLGVASYTFVCKSAETIENVLHIVHVSMDDWSPQFYEYIISVESCYICNCLVSQGSVRWD